MQKNQGHEFPAIDLFHRPGAALFQSDAVAESLHAKGVYKYAHLTDKETEAQDALEQARTGILPIIVTL